jgi:hypothetical protein
LVTVSGTVAERLRPAPVAVTVRGYVRGLVVIWVVTVRTDEPGTVSVAGTNLPGIPGAFESASETVPLNPASGVTVTVNRPVAPWLTLADGGLSSTAKSGRSTTRAVDVVVAVTPFTFVTVVRTVKVPVALQACVPTMSYPPALATS